MQQHLMQLQPLMASPSQVTTDVIQQYLDENKQLILAILEYQNSGKADDCAQIQARLQHNLMYLAAIADGQSQLPTIGQYPPNGLLQFGPRYMPHQQQAQQMTTPQSLMAARSSSILYPHSATVQQQQHQHQAMLHSQLGMSSGFSLLHGSEGGNSGGMFLDFGHSGVDVMRSEGGRGVNSSGQNRDEIEHGYMKSSEEDGSGS